MLFQSTPPVKAATKGCVVRASANNISIHAAREGGDPQFSAVFCAFRISIHAAREGGDANFRFVRIAHMDFNPRRP